MRPALPNIKPAARFSGSKEPVAMRGGHATVADSRSVMSIRPLFFATFATAAVATGGYFAFALWPACSVPLAYHLDEPVDARFSLSEDEAYEVMQDAVALWETAVGRTLFVRSAPEDADLAVRFVFDERQARFNAARDIEEVLERKQLTGQEVRLAREALVHQYQELQQQHERDARSYHTRLQEHNREVERWNQDGGAPSEVFKTLTTRERELERERAALNTHAAKLNRLVENINLLGTQGNEVIDAYNEIVRGYNEEFAGTREFTQGNYQSGVITVYQFAGRDELVLVLAHELGHALSLGHVESPSAVMHAFMGQQDISRGLHRDDYEEFMRVCTPHPFAWR